MKKKIARRNRDLTGFLASPKIMHVVLPYMMVLLVAGTVAQKELGLFTATKMFFTSFILWVGIVPLPGGATALAILLVNLCAYFTLNSQWTKNALGSTLTHLGVIVLLLGGLVTLADKKEGFIILRHGQPAAAFYDYHRRDFTITKNGAVLIDVPFSSLREEQRIDHADLPFTVRIATLRQNSFIDAADKLQKLEAKKEEETNQAGLVVIADRKAFSLAEFTRQQRRLKTKNDTYAFSLKRRANPLPFMLDLRQLDSAVYPGTNMAQSYSTQFYVREADHSWPAHVSMNDPLRYKGYTFYQASILTLPNGEQASVLNTVADAGWLFPYAATALVCIGLFLNAWVRRHAKK